MSIVKKSFNAPFLSFKKKLEKTKNIHEYRRRKLPKNDDLIFFIEYFSQGIFMNIHPYLNTYIDEYNIIFIFINIPIYSQNVKWPTQIRIFMNITEYW